MILRSLQVIFSKKDKEWDSVGVTCVEDYNGSIYDLLASQAGKPLEIDSLKSGPDYISNVDCFTLPKDEDNLIEALDDQLMPAI